MYVTILDVARTAGVSPSTVNRMIAGGYASDEARQKIAAAMAKLGFTPHQRRPAVTYTCEVAACEKRGPTRVCGMHRERMRIHGSYDLPARVSVDAAFWSQVDVGAGCWTWQGRLNEQGYGVFSATETAWYAHRYSFVRLVGEIPEGLELDHTCNNPRCVSPAHLEPVTGIVNRNRGAERRRTCRRGHPWVASNIYIRPDTGYRCCRACIAIRRAVSAGESIQKETSDG